MISLTAAAIEQFHKIRAEEKMDTPYVRVKVIGGGCAGFSYDMFFDDADPTEMDETFSHDGVVIVCDPLSFQYVDGVVIDYVEELIRSGFKFLNPNVKATCGCGSSFSA